MTKFAGWSVLFLLSFLVGHFVANPWRFPEGFILALLKIYIACLMVVVMIANLIRFLNKYELGWELSLGKSAEQDSKNSNNGMQLSFASAGTIDVAEKKTQRVLSASEPICETACENARMLSSLNSEALHVYPEVNGKTVQGNGVKKRAPIRMLSSLKSSAAETAAKREAEAIAAKQAADSAAVKRAAEVAAAKQEAEAATNREAEAVAAKQAAEVAAAKMEAEVVAGKRESEAAAKRETEAVAAKQAAEVAAAKREAEAVAAKQAAENANTKMEAEIAAARRKIEAAAKREAEAVAAQQKAEATAVKRAAEIAASKRELEAAAKREAEAAAAKQAAEAAAVKQAADHSTVFISRNSCNLRCNKAGGLLKGPILPIYCKYICDRPAKNPSGKFFA